MTDIDLDAIKARERAVIEAAKDVVKVWRQWRNGTAPKGQVIPIRALASTVDVLALGPVADALTSQPAPTKPDGVLAQIAQERQRQDARWGEQNHPDGTGPKPGVILAAAARLITQQAAADGSLTWRLILWEEVAEAFEETDPAKVRAELIQVAAVAVAWAEAIDRRAESRMAQADGEAGGP